MITFTKEKFNALAGRYLSHIESATPDAARHITALMGLIAPADAPLEEYVRLLLGNPTGRDVLGAFCVHMHYWQSGRNITVGGIGIPSEISARKIDSAIRSLARKAEQDRLQRQSRRRRETNRELNGRQAEAAALRRQIRALRGEVTDCHNRIGKAERAIAEKERLLSEAEARIRELDGTGGSDADRTLAQAVRLCNEWLAPSGLSVEVTRGPLKDGLVGSYEAGSVFSKLIRITIDTDRIGRHVDDYPFEDEKEQIRLTVYHEMGHALVEQIEDWQVDLDEVKELVRGEFGARFEEVFTDALPEEDLVEDFAHAFDRERPSTLGLCFEELNARLSGTPAPGTEPLRLDVAGAAETLERFFHLDKERTTIGPFDLNGWCEGCGCNGFELYATKVEHPTGKGILVHNPCNGQYTRALLIPEEEFIYGENLREALEWLKGE